MNNRNLTKFFCTLAVGIFAASAANATLVVSSSVGGAPIGVAHVNFDNLPLGNAGGNSGGIGVSFTGDGQTVQGASSGVYAAPFMSNNNGVPFGAADGADTTPYLSTGVGSVKLVLPSMMHYLGLLWGSVDSYNTLELYNGAALVGTVTGNNVWANANGDQGVNGTYYVNITSNIAFDNILALSSQYAFEFDNVAFNREAANGPPPSVPEPGTMSLLAAAVGLFGLFQLRRRAVLVKA